MQTFLPYPDFAQSAACLDNKRLGKQRVECLQILKTLAKERTEVVQYEHSDGSIYSRVRKTPWYNHPAVKMWRGHEFWLADYAWAICEEWTKRGYKDTCLDKICAIRIVINATAINTTCPPWLGNEAFHASHRSNLLRKDPKHYSQFGWIESDNLPYVWPV